MCAISEVSEVGGSAVVAGACGPGPCSGICKKLQPAASEEAKGDEIQLPIAVSDAFAAEILKPYRANATYLKSAEITHFSDKLAITCGSADQRLLTGLGHFSIPESCYIDDTGHFNAVEFNICFNQLAYVLFAKSVETGLLHRFRAETFEVPSLPEFKQYQLPAMVIVSIESRYYKQLDSSSFTGELTINKMSSVGSAWFFFTTITFADREGIKAKGSVVLAYDRSFAPVRH